MDVAAILAEYAAVRENLLFVTAGGITLVWRPSYPAPFNNCLALVFELHPIELGRPHELQFVVQDEDGTRLEEMRGGLEVGPTLEAGDNAIVPLALDLRQVVLPRPGVYSVELAVDGQHQHSLRFKAVLSGPDGGRPPPDSPAPTPDMPGYV